MCLQMEGGSDEQIDGQLDWLTDGKDKSDLRYQFLLIIILNSIIDHPISL